MKPLLFASGFLLAVFPASALDLNGNQQSDIWEMVHGAPGLSPSADADSDGYTNAAESLAGTHPLDSSSFPRLTLTRNGALLSAGWWGFAGKRYTIQSRLELNSGAWILSPTGVTGQGSWTQSSIDPSGAPHGFFRLDVADQDTDGDGINDWEERAVGFDPNRSHSDNYTATDPQRITAGLTAPNTIVVSAYDDTFSERWPDPAVIALRRTGGGLQPLAVNVSFTGSAIRGSDYTTPFAGNVVHFGPGVREVFVELTPVADSADAESDETITVTALAGTGYGVGAQNAGTATLKNETGGSPPSAKAAARFMIQAAFGPDQDSADDPDHIPENVEEVMAMGFEAWIDDQFTRPVGTLRPFVEWAAAQPGTAEIYNDTKQDAWWGRVMGLPKLRPDAVATQLPDPLRQRVGFALSQIFVISDRMEDIGVDRRGMAAYYDLLLEHSFGNYRDLLFHVSTHPCMGMYLSHLGNRKYNPTNGTFPDENYAREVMQLFSIGLWMLNDDGTRILDDNDQPIPTYDNSNITEFARVFTGLAFGGTNVNFGLHPRDFTVPMKAWDAEHDLAPKTLLLGATTPARTASAGNTGTATFDDVNAAIDNLFHHPNTGPFVARLLIQRFITSNPTPGYIQRVAAAFANNGSGLRGDMKAVIKAILLDDEARNPAMMSHPHFGKLREPMLKCVNFARAFNASSPEGWYYLDAFTLDHVQEPMKSPSVFNFYLPSYTPPGPLAQAGLVAPEFQIINATSGVTAPNYFWNSVGGILHRWGMENPVRQVRLNLEQEHLLHVPPEAIGQYDPDEQPLDPDPLLRRLDLVLTGGTLTPRNFQIIREAMQRTGPATNGDWVRDRMRLAICLIMSTPEFAVQR